RVAMVSTWPSLPTRSNRVPSISTTSTLPSGSATGPSGKRNPVAMISPSSFSCFMNGSSCGVAVFLAAAKIGVDGLLAAFAAAQRLFIEIADDLAVAHHPGAGRQAGRHVEALFHQQRRQLLFSLDGGQALVDAGDQHRSQAQRG